MLRVPAKVDYAIRALVALARVAPTPVKGDRLSADEQIPFRFLEVTLGELARAGILESRRGADGGYWLSRPPAEVPLVEVLLTLEGTLVEVRSRRVASGATPPTAIDAQLDALWSRAEFELHALFAGVSLQDLLDLVDGAASGDGAGLVEGPGPLDAASA